MDHQVQQARQVKEELWDFLVKEENAECQGFQVQRYGSN